MKRGIVSFIAALYISVTLSQNFGSWEYFSGTDQLGTFKAIETPLIGANEVIPKREPLFAITRYKEGSQLTSNKRNNYNDIFMLSFDYVEDLSGKEGEILISFDSNEKQYRFIIPEYNHALPSNTWDFPPFKDTCPVPYNSPLGKALSCSDITILDFLYLFQEYKIMNVTISAKGISNSFSISLDGATTAVNFLLNDF